jgi:hypothetical protein
MSDYLARLAGRVRHASPVLQPWLPSFFELTMAGAETSLKAEQTAVEPSLVSERETAQQKVATTSNVLLRWIDRESSSGVANDPAEKRQRAEPVRRDSSETLEQPAGERRAVPRTHDSGERTERTRSPYDVAPEQIFRARPQDRGISDTGESFQPRSEHQNVISPMQRMAHPQPEIASTAILPAQSPPTDKVNQATGSESIRRSRFLEQEHSSLKLHPLLEPREQPHPQVQRRLGIETAPPALPTSIARSLGELRTKLASPLPAAPEIHVTIGRIEVRAVSSPASIQRERPPRKPELSLDDYLRLRNQGTA